MPTLKDMCHHFVRTKDATLLHEFHKFKNRLNAVTKKEKATYYQGHVSRVINDPRQI